MNPGADIIALDAASVRAAQSELAAVLLDCIAGGASVSFMTSFSRNEAEAFFADVADAVARDATVLLAARRDGRIVGTVQLGINLPPNQPHRADVKKLLVHRSVRGRGIGAALMRSVEEVARLRGRSLMVLDTATGGEAERLYARLGWTAVGVIPDYALWPDGRLCSTTVFWKRVAPYPS